MVNYPVIDAHVHTYKTPEIGRQALSGFDVVGCCGTPEELVSIMKKAGIRLAVQCNMTPARTMLEAALASMPPEDAASARPNVSKKISERIRRRNAWTCETARAHQGLVPFVSVDPIMGEDAMREEVLHRIEQQGAKGIKIHPGEGHFFPHDTSLWPVYALIEKRGLAVISHGGLDIANPDPEYTRPTAFTDVAKRFPKLRLVIAHMGRDFFEDSVRIAQGHPNIYFDTSAIIPGNADGEPLEGVSSLSNGEAVQLIRKIGVDRVMFGSDYPWFHPHWDLKRFLKLGFGNDELEALLGGNAKRILGL
jgi:predicted TIM-barrel fold metal-dependent hydrolase